MVVAACFWWAYFDVVALVAERRLHDLDGTDQVRLARDSYMYLHFPMVAGIILFALGVKKVLGHVDEPLKAVPAVALCGGAALYLLAHVAFRLRNVGSVSVQRSVAAVVCVALVPVAQRVPGLVALGLVAAVTVALIAYESIRPREARRQVRAAH